MKAVAVAIRELLTRIGGWFGVEGAWLLAAALLLSVWAYRAVGPDAPWAVLGILCLAAWFALTTRRA